jgi:hypothetical protein
MAAPTPVSAFLHSATMVKAGVYLMARLHPALSGTEIWMWTLTIFGAITAVFASVVALRQTDLKQALAYTTLMALGTLTLFLGQESGYAMTAFATFLIVHSLYKAALFLVVGNIDYATGTRDARILGGLARTMPVTAFAAALAAMSMAGLSALSGLHRQGAEICRRAGRRVRAPCGGRGDPDRQRADACGGRGCGDPAVLAAAGRGVPAPAAAGALADADRPGHSRRCSARPSASIPTRWSARWWRRRLPRCWARRKRPSRWCCGRASTCR